MDRKKVIYEGNKQGVELGRGKLTKTGNDLDNLNKLNNNNPRFKRNIKGLKNKITQDKENDEGYNGNKYEYTCYQLGRKQSKSKS